MDGFDFRDKYVDLNGDDQKSEEDIQKEILKLRFDDDDDDDPSNGDDNDQNKKNKKKTIGIILITILVVVVSVAALGGFAIYRADKAPAIKSVHIESDNFDNPSLGLYGNMITLSFSFDKELADKPMVVIMNKTVEVYGEGKDYYAKYYVQMQDKVDIPVTFSIHDYRDTFRKTGPPITTTTDGSSVTIPAFH